VAAIAQPAAAEAPVGPFGTEREFVDQQFRDSLFGPWTGDEQETMVVDVERGFPAEQAIERLVTDRRSFGPIVRFYYAFFGREPDTGGLLHWSEVRRDGMALETLAWRFTLTPEFLAIYGALDNGQFLDVVYQNVLHRAPDAAGRAYWLGLLDQRMDRYKILHLFSGSNEHVETTRNRVDRTSVHAAMLREVPSPAWLDMTAGTPLTDVIGTILHSSEYAARF
jgi:hypothetical protein